MLKKKINCQTLAQIRAKTCTSTTDQPSLSMSRIVAGKWVSRISETVISIASLLIFFLLDILDVMACFFFRLVDELLEGKASSCYCMPRDQTQQQDSFAVDDGESELSETLHGRRNIFRETWLLKIPKITSKNGSIIRADKRNRWSDCGCESCVSPMNDEGTDSKLHLVVKERKGQDISEQNAIFIHGFLSSSSYWKGTGLLNLSDHAKQNYRLFAVDLLGFGRSPKPKDCLYTLSDHIKMIEKSVIVPFQLNSFHLVAHSMGCVIALALAAKFSASVKSITLIAPPYFSDSRGDASAEAFRRLAPRRVWPPLLFGSAFMSWYEHLGRCVCFFICKNHRAWEWLLKLLTRRDLHYFITDSTCHTHHSAWHTMHNVICGGAKFLDKYLEVLRAAGAKIYVVHGSKDQVVPVECSFNMKMKDPEIHLDIIPDADHNTVILGRAEDFTRNLERFWGSTDEKQQGRQIDERLENT